MMVRFIGMEYLAALALIKLNKEEISLSELNDFRINVIKALEDNQISSVFLFSDNYAVELVRNYSDCFELTNLSRSSVYFSKASNLSSIVGCFGKF